MYFLQKPLNKAIYTFRQLFLSTMFKTLQSRSKKVLLHNAAKEELGFVQYWPSLLTTSRSGQIDLPVFDGGAALGQTVMPRDINEQLDNGLSTPWPRDRHGDYQHKPLPEPAVLETKRHGWGICLAVSEKDTRGVVRILRKIDCDAGKVIILLEEIRQRKTMEQRDLDQIQQQMFAGTGES